MPEIFSAQCVELPADSLSVHRYPDGVVEVETHAPSGRVNLSPDDASRLTAALIAAGFGPAQKATPTDNHEARLVRLESAEQAALAMFGRRIEDVGNALSNVDFGVCEVSRRVTALETRLNSAAAELKG